MTSPKVNRHNAAVLEELEEGDLVEFRGELYSHWAVYVGCGRIVHRTGNNDDDRFCLSCHMSSSSDESEHKAVVREDDFWEVVKNSRAFKNNFLDERYRVVPKEKIVQNARKRIGEIGYSLLHDNCEHFAVWCRYGTKKSKQADDAIFWYVLSGIVIWVAVLVTLTVSTVDDADKNI